MLRNRQQALTARRGSRIRDIAVVLPSGVLTSDEAASSTGLSAQVRREKLGIESVRVSVDGETPSVLGARAVDALLKQSGAEPGSIEFLIFVTQNPDYRLPTTACLIQSRCGLPNSVLAFDINQGCSGYVVGLAQAHALLSAGLANRGILVTCDAYSRIVSQSDKDTFGLFGDAATATLLEATQPDEGLQAFQFGTDGLGAEHLILRNGGALSNEADPRGNFLYMNGRAIYNFVTEKLPPELDRFLNRAGLSNDQVDAWFFHQANLFMNSKLCSLMKIPSEKAFFDIRETGNTVSSSIPLALSKARALSGSEPKNLVFCGFGVGLSWAMCLYKFSPQD
jgi:3-oxoacyl-[acyl-carrier-protein] synthase-3